MTTPATQAKNDVGAPGFAVFETWVGQDAGVLPYPGLENRQTWGTHLILHDAGIIPESSLWGGR
jgi:hypothetical protein